MVLITFALLFGLRFFVNDDDGKGRQDFIHSELAANFLSAFFKTTTDCNDNGLSFAELYKDCASGGTPINCNGQTSCEYINEKTEFLLNKILGTEMMNKEYKFTATTPNTPPTIVSLPDIPPTCKSWKSKIYGIPLNPGTIVIKLDICN